AYQPAGAEYSAAYELFGEPEFFFDVAEVYKLAGDEASALTYYEKYLELDPRGRGAAVARASSQELRRSIAATEDAARRAEEDKRKAEAQAQAQVPPPKAPELPPAPARSESPGRGLRIAGMGTGAAGAIAIGVGVAFGLRARAIGSETATWDTFDPQRYAEGKAAQRNMIIFTGVGAAALVAGGVLFYLGGQAGPTAESGKGLTLAPAIGPAEIRLTAAGRF